MTRSAFAIADRRPQRPGACTCRVAARAQTAFVATRGSTAPPLLLEAVDGWRRSIRLARETYLDALSAAMFAGRFAGLAEARLEVA